MRNTTEQERYFGTELTPKGVMPIWIAISNRSADTLAFDAHDVRVDVSGNAISEPQRSRHPINTAGEEGIVLAGAALISLPLLFAGAKMLSDSSEIQRNIMEKQIYSRTISPNQSESGFIYTSIDPAHPSAMGYTLTVILRKVPITAADQGKPYRISF